MYHNSIQNVVQTNIHVTHVCTNAGEMSNAQTDGDQVPYMLLLSISI